MRRKRLTLTVALAVAAAAAAGGGLAWKQAKDRDQRCERDFYALEAAVKDNLAGGAPASADLQQRVQTCMDDGWRLG